MAGFGKDGKGYIMRDNFEQAPGTLAAQDVIATAHGALERKFRILKTEGWISWNPGAVGDTILVGIADANLTAAEIEECLEALPVDQFDVPAIEQIMRGVFPLAMLGSDSTGFVDGHAILNKKGWTYDLEGWTFWVRNQDSATALTASEVYWSLTHYGMWVD